MLLDAVVHQGLGEGRLVALVMAVPAIAEHVDDDVFLEGLAELRGDPGHVHHRLHVVAVHVKDRRLNDLGDIGAVGAGAGVHRIGGEADLVVDDEVDRSADAVAFQLREVEGLRHQALAGEGGIAVQQQGHHLGAVGVAMLHLLGADLADHDGVDRLQVRWVCGQRQMHGVAVELPVARGAQVVLHVAGAADVFRVGRAAAELVEDRLVGLAHEVGQDVQAAAVRHAEHHFLQAQLTAALEDLLETRNHRLGAFQAEALGAGVLLVEELLEGFGRRQALQDRPLAGHREGGAVERLVFDALLDPALLIGVLNVHELDADRAAVDHAADLDDLVQGRDLAPENAVDEDRPVQILFREAVGGRIQLGMGDPRRQAERIELRFQVSAHAIGTDQHQGADRVDRGAPDVILRERVGRQRCGRGSSGRGRAVGGGRRAETAGQELPGALVQIVEELAPALADGAGIGPVGIVEIEQLGCARTKQKRGVVRVVGGAGRVRHACLSAGPVRRDGPRRPSLVCGRPQPPLSSFLRRLEPTRARTTTRNMPRLPTPFR